MSLLLRSSYNSNGDGYEINFGGLICPKFPNCELFWKLFVVPLTERITGYPNELNNNIRIRAGIEPELENIANTNYSMFLNFIYAHLHLTSEMISDLENFYTHLGSVCDLAESFLEKWYFLLIKCRGDECETLQQLTRGEFLNLTGGWFDKYYPTLFEHYLSKGKAPPIRIPSRKNIIKELFQKYLKNDHLRKRYFELS